MFLKQFTLGPLVNNMFLLYNKSGEAVLIDASFDIGKVIEFINENNLALQKVILTHGHIDHIHGVRRLKEELNPEIMVHKYDLELYNNINKQGEMFGFQTQPPPQPDTLIDSEFNIDHNGTLLKILETPGHSPGAICISTKINGENILFSGDTLFQGSIGRTDLWGGSFQTIKNSIKNKLYVLPDETVVYPGHGDKTTIGQEKRSNPFVRV